MTSPTAHWASRSWRENQFLRTRQERGMGGTETGRSFRITGEGNGASAGLWDRADLCLWAGVGERQAWRGGPTRTGPALTASYGWLVRAVRRRSACQVNSRCQQCPDGFGERVFECAVADAGPGREFRVASQGGGRGQRAQPVVPP